MDAWTESQYHVTHPSEVELQPQHLFYFHHPIHSPVPGLKMQIRKYCKFTRHFHLWWSTSYVVNLTIDSKPFLFANFFSPFTLSLYFKFFIPGVLVTVRVLFSIMQIGRSALLILMKATLLVIGWKRCDSPPCSQEGFGGFHLIKLSALADSMHALI